MKKKVIIACIVVLLLGIILFLVLNNKNKEVECEGFTGGGFDVVFNTNGGNKIDNLHVCIACAPDTYSELPVPEKKGSEFDGWYYDKNFKEKVDAKTTFDIKIIESKDKNGCMTGYEDITLYAKWK